MAKTKKRTMVKLTIDHPKADEVIWGGHYAVRISIPQDEAAEISIDGSTWMRCRHEAGHCWFDMHNLADGEHKMAVRVIKDGEAGVSLRNFNVSRE